MGSTTTTFCCRLWTIIIAILLWLVGAAITGICIYLRFDYWVNRITDFDNEDVGMFRLYLYGFLAAGAVILVFALVGIYGAARPDKVALITYLVFLPLVLIAMVAVSVLVYVYRENIENTIQNSNFLRDIIQTEYGTNDRIEQSVNIMQRELHCCGGTSFEDYHNSVWSKDSSTTVPNERENKLPNECCSDWQKYEHDPVYRYCPMYDLSTDNTNINNALKEVHPLVYRQGCNVALVKFLQDNIVIPAAIGISIACLVIVALVVVIILLCYLRKDPVPRQDDVVYEMARTQEKSPYPARGGPYANLYQS